MAKTTEILEKLDDIILALTGGLNIGLTIVQGSLGAYKLIREHFASKDPSKNWTQEEIDKEANEAVQGLTERYERIQHGKTIEEEAEESEDEDDSDDDLE